MHDTFLNLLQDRAHWEFELFLMILFDGIVAGILWPFVRLHWRHHLDRDRRELGPAWKRKVGEVTEDDSNTWTNAGPINLLVRDYYFVLDSGGRATVQSRYSRERGPHETNRTTRVAWLVRKDVRPAYNLGEPEKTMDTPIGGGW